MKPTNLLAKLCVLATLVMAGVCPALAADFMVDSIWYNVIGENEVEVTRGDVKYSGEMMIPSTVVNDGTTYQVTRIGNNAFYSCNGLTAVDISEGITHIGTYAFAYCQNLEMVEFPNSLVCLEDYAFFSCVKLATIYIPRNLVEISPWAFSRCSGITSIMCSAWNPSYKAMDGVLFDKDVTALYVYPRASLMSSYEIPPTVTVIQPVAFYNADNLVSVTIPESVTWVGNGAFEYCDLLESLDFPDGVTFIGPSCFYACEKLSYLHLPESLDTIRNSIGGDLPSLTDLVIPRNVRYISEYAFMGSTGIKTLTFEEGSCLETIGLRAFDGLTSLESVDMPNSVLKMGGQVFGNCTSLKYAHLSDNLQELGNSTFTRCTSLLESAIPGGVPVIGNLYIDCTSLRKVRIGDRNATPGTTMIKNAAISGSYALEYLELGANVDSLQTLAINDIDSLRTLISWAAIPPKCNSYWETFSPDADKLNCTLFVPRASLEAYRTAHEWKKFKNVVAIEDLGDINSNGMIDIADVTDLIDQVLAGEIVNPAISDVDFDGIVGISDVTALIDQILSGD